MLLHIALLIQLQTGLSQNAAPDQSDQVEQVDQAERSRVMESPNQYVGLTTIGWDPMGRDGFYGDWPWGSDGITGGWGGLRDDLEEHGIRLFGEYSSFLQENFTGGLGTGFYGAGAVELALIIDTDRFVGIPGGTFVLNYGYSSWYNQRYEPSGLYDPTGSWLGDNANFLAPGQTSLNQVNQLYWRQELFDDTLRVTFGKLDACATFVSLPSTSGFNYAGAGYMGQISQFIPTYPNEATGLELSLDVTEQVTASFGWFDGTTAAFDPATGQTGPATGSRGPSTFFDNDGHWFLIAQCDVSWNLDDTRPGTFGVGGWVQTGTSLTAGDSTTGVEDVPGCYLLLQQTIFAPDASFAAAGGGVQAFGRLAWSPPEKSPVGWSFLLGVSATGVIPQRPADAIGIMGSVTCFSNQPEVYRSLEVDGTAGSAGGNESAIEVFYRAQLLPSVFVQPGIEWIANPSGGDPATLDDAVAGYLEINIQF
jgi:porin